MVLIGRQSAILLLLALCIVWTAKLHVHTHTYIADIQSIHADVEIVTPKNHEAFSVGMEHAFGENHPMISDTPPAEETWLLSSPDSSSHNINRIPRRLNKIYFQKDGQFHRQFLDKHGRNVTSALKEAHKSWTTLNPGYQVHYFDLLSARSYLHAHFHPVFLRTFDCIQAFAGKSDFFRVALLYREGGFHSDWKQVCLEHNLLDQIANETEFFVALDIGNGFTQKSRSCVSNAFIGSTPKHPITAKYLELAMNNVQTSLYPMNTLLVTGPCLLGIAVLHFKKDFGDDHASTPVHDQNHTYLNGQRAILSHFSWKGRHIIEGKCKDCGSGQDWSMGNNYNTLFEKRTYYCEDSASIFQPPFST